ncbi:MAG: hypothetical protein V1776_00395 [Candidatus Diapherotrites archaeon]
MQAREWIILCALLFAFPSAHATLIEGTVYDGLTLEAVQNAIVTLDTNPAQTKLAKDGIYSFEAGEGKYTLKATLMEQGIVVQEAIQLITIEGEKGTYTIDLILLPIIGEIPDVTLPDEEPPITVWDQLAQSTIGWWMVIGIVLVGAGYAILNVRKNTFSPTEEEKKQVEKKTEEKKEEIILDTYAKEALHHLQRGGNRMTQKELRALVNIGEAKVSLVVSEMESYGFIKKIKKGRGNILILTEKGREQLAKEEKGKTVTLNA